MTSELLQVMKENISKCPFHVDPTDSAKQPQEVTGSKLNKDKVQTNGDPVEMSKNTSSNEDNEILNNSSIKVKEKGVDSKDNSNGNMKVTPSKPNLKQEIKTSDNSAPQNHPPLKDIEDSFQKLNLQKGISSQLKISYSEWNGDEPHLIKVPSLQNGYVNGKDLENGHQGSEITNHNKEEEHLNHRNQQLNHKNEQLSHGSQELSKKVSGSLRTNSQFQVNQSLASVPIELFISLVPYHIIFDSNLTILQCGNMLQTVSPGVKKGKDLTEVRIDFI